MLSIILSCVTEVRYVMVEGGFGNSGVFLAHNYLSEQFGNYVEYGICTIISLKSVSPTTFADCRSQFLLDRLGRCLKLIVSYRGTSSHEFASQFGLEFVYTRKNYKNTVSARSLTVSATTVRTAQQERQFIPKIVNTSSRSHG